MLGALQIGQVTAAERGPFLDRHWARPLAAQGKAPASFTAGEADLSPAACGACHIAQFEGWRNSLHSRAMGPGVLGQLLDLDAAAADEHQDCLRCHAPLAEQALDLSHAIRKRSRGSHEWGLTCAGCHVRGQVRYGPPRRDGSAADPATPLPHGGWQAAREFEDSRFCAACHQFEADGYALNGKLLENTYEEWRASRHAREGRNCQTCHMPDRAHLWRGIHDPKMVRSGVTIRADAARVAAGRVRASLAIANTGTGHAFPTYVTPRVVLEMFQQDAAGRPLARTRRMQAIERRVSPDLSREIADTRLLPDQRMSLSYDLPIERAAAALVSRVRVEPDAFYVGVYRDALSRRSTQAGRAMLERALATARSSGYTLFERRDALRSARKESR